MNDLTELSKEIHETAKSKDFYNDPENPWSFPKAIALIHSEVSEALQADRKGQPLPIPEYFEKRIEGKTDKLYTEMYEAIIKDTVPQELAGAIIRILDLCAYLEIDIQKFIDLEVRFNKLRPHKHGKKY